MARAVTNDFAEFEVLDWDSVHKEHFFSLEEVACLMAGLDWHECMSRIRSPNPTDAPLTIRKLKASIEIKHKELERLAKENPGLLIKRPSISSPYDHVVMIEMHVYYTKESIKAFLLHCFPNERPQFLYPDAEPALSEEEATQKELRELRAQVKQLQKLALGLAIDQHDYNPASSTNRGMVQLEATLANAEYSFNQTASPTNKINIKMSKETIKKYLTQAYEAVKA